MGTSCNLTGIVISLTSGIKRKLALDRGAVDTKHLTGLAEMFSNTFRPSSR